MRGAAFRTKPFSLAKTCSIGLRSGEYLGRKRRRAPADLFALRTALPLCDPRLSATTMSSGLRAGTRNCADAQLDRLARRVRILAMNGESYRLKQSAGRRRAARAEQNKAADAGPDDVVAPAQHDPSARANQLLQACIKRSAAAAARSLRRHEGALHSRPPQTSRLASPEISPPRWRTFPPPLTSSSATRARG